MEDPWGSSFWSAVIALRREIHRHPEGGFAEVETQRRLHDALTTFAGIPAEQIRKCAQTGLIADIRGEGPAVDRQGAGAVRCVALRADMDALSMTEANTGLPYRSQNEGFAHMCGHDGHMSALVGAARLLQQRRSAMPRGSCVRLLFQPAEEGTAPGTAGYDFKRTGGGGAKPMIDEGCLEGVDEVYGWHNWPAWELGELRVKEGAVMARESEFEVKISGRGGHGSQPHLCIDPVICGAHLVTALQTVVSRNVPSPENAVVSITMFQGGERLNVIPDAVRLGGTIRDMGDPAASVIKKRVPKLVRSICDSFDCTAEIRLDQCNPPVVNTACGVETVERAAKRLPASLGLRASTQGLPLLAGEDFAYYLQERPGCFFFLGTSEPKLHGLSMVPGLSDSSQARSNCICHGTDFDFNDNVLPRAIAMFVHIAEDRLGMEHSSEAAILKLLDLPDAEREPKRQRITEII